jgi:SAM-dependent methyltransferase
MPLLLEKENPKRHTTWEFNQTSKELAYSSHPIFRYFGKLPPTMTNKILVECLNDLNPRSCSITDIMCGSGTTLVEAARIGFDKIIGIDVNPISILVSKVKTQPVSPKAPPKFPNELNVLSVTCLLENELCLRYAKKALGHNKEHINTLMPETRNLDYWFPENLSINIAVLKATINSVYQGTPFHDLALVTFSSLIRKYSMADNGPGRLFYKKGKQFKNIFLDFNNRFNANLSTLKNSKSDFIGKKISVLQQDARKTTIKDNSQDIVFFHPPYFALYKYSSDVLRFELEWNKFNRKSIAENEIRDGFKTSKAEDLDKYISDLKDVFIEVKRILKPHGKLAVVNNNSTLAKKQLPVIDNMNSELKSLNFGIKKIISRPVKYSQASYHRSADEKISTEKDYILIYEKRS